MKKYSLLLIFMISISESLCFGGVYYVSPTGTAKWDQCVDINNPCSPATAFANAKAGDTVYFRGGTYMVPNGPAWYLAGYRPSNSGTATNPIVFEGYQDEIARFVPSSTFNTNPMLGYHSPSGNQGYHIWRKLTIDTTGGSSNGLAAFFFGSMGENLCIGETIENCTIIGHQINDINTHWGAIMAYSNCAQLTVRNCRIYGWKAGSGADSWAITMWDNSNNIIENNEIYNCYGGLHFVQTGSNNVVRYNYIYDMTAEGIYVWYQNGGNSNLKIYQNIIKNTGNHGIFFTAGGPLPNAQVYNNTLYQAGGIAPAVATGTEIFNNIIWNTSIHSEGGSLIYHHDSSIDPSVVDYNCYWKGSSGTVRFGYRIYNGGSYYTSMPWSPQSYDTNSKNQNPMFVNAGGTSPRDYKLQAGSPARTGGRGGVYSIVMGAYITGNECIGLLNNCNTPPSPPRNLRIQ